MIAITRLCFDPETAGKPAERLSDMPALKNPKHEAFAQAVALGMPASQAYGEYVSGGKCSESTAETTGPKLARESQVNLRISELRKGVEEDINRKFSMTKDEWLGKLKKAAEQADSTSGQVAALREIGKGMGYYEPEQTESKLEIVIRKL